MAGGLSFRQNVLDPPKPAGIPDRLGTLGLVNATDGAEATASINKLHGTSIELVSAYIANYAHSSPYHNVKTTVWVGRAANQEAAIELINKMAEAITRGGSGFSNLQRLTVAGQDIFQVRGPGGAHFFYNSRKSPEEVIWLTIEAAETSEILEEAIKTF
ncbi:MAG: hypothetical protein Q8Q07_01790 [Dehalococcoidales bacterium]|nr:hypothetical protein [Dehalococcoidales bacterium]MDZ4230912.1 hypothetical protein [Dehalococcoidales bacterium]